MNSKGRYVTLHFIQYPRAKYWWAIKQMAGSRAPLAAMRGLVFSRMLGTGGGSGYGVLPDLGTYALLCSWPDEERARTFMSSDPLFQIYRDHATEIYTLHMSPLSARGRWSGVEPFEPAVPPVDGPLAVITRATLRPHYIIPFWLSVAGVVRSSQEREGLIFTKGMGDIPWIMQATFSVWRSLEDMAAFAHAQGGSHQQVIARTRRMNGFSEELYSRFVVTDTEGSWHGTDPVRAALEPLGSNRTPSLLRPEALHGRRP
jgi:hypothetical protein